MQDTGSYRQLLTVSLVEGFVIKLLSAPSQVEGSWYIRETVDQGPRILAQGVEESSSNHKDGQRQHNLSQQSVIAATNLSHFNAPELGSDYGLEPQARHPLVWEPFSVLVRHYARVCCVIMHWQL